METCCAEQRLPRTLPCVLGEWRQEDQKLRATLGYILISRPAWVTQDLVSKPKATRYHAVLYGHDFLDVCHTQRPTKGH